MNATTVAVDLAKSVFQLAVAALFDNLNAADQPAPKAIGCKGMLSMHLNKLARGMRLRNSHPIFLHSGQMEFDRFLDQLRHFGPGCANRDTPW